MNAVITFIVMVIATIMAAGLLALLIDGFIDALDERKVRRLMTHAVRKREQFKRPICPCRLTAR